MPYHLFSVALLLLFCCGCASPVSRDKNVEAGPPGYALFSITLHCDDAEAPVPSVDDMVEMELAGRPYLPAGEREAPDGWGVPFDACSTLLESMRDGAQELLPTARYERTQRSPQP